MAAVLAASALLVGLLSGFSVAAIPVLRGLLVLAGVCAVVAIAELKAVRHEGDECSVTSVFGVRRVTKPFIDILSRSQGGAQLYLGDGRARLILHGGFMNLSRAASEAERLGRCLGLPVQIDPAILEAAAMQRRSFALGRKIGLPLLLGVIIVAFALQALLMSRTP